MMSWGVVCLLLSLFPRLHGDLVAVDVTILGGTLLDASQLPAYENVQAVEPMSEFARHTRTLDVNETVQELDVEMLIHEVTELSEAQIGAPIRSQLVVDELFVAQCEDGTFSSDTSGVCRACGNCSALSFELRPCVHTSDIVCQTCAVCGEHDFQLCECRVKTSTCFVGNRVCLTLLPASVSITLTLLSPQALTSAQQADAQSVLQTAYAAWLASQFDEPSVSGASLRSKSSTSYVITFVFTGIYDQSHLKNISGATAVEFQDGIDLLFGGTGRRLLSSATFTVPAVTQTCLVDGVCPPFSQLNGSCTNVCVPSPCPIGYTLLPGSQTNCTYCEMGTYKDTTGNAACTPCAVGYTTTGLGSPSLGNCSLIPTTTTTPPSTTPPPPTTTNSSVRPTPTPAVAQSPLPTPSPAPSSNEQTVLIVVAAAVVGVSLCFIGLSQIQMGVNVHLNAWIKRRGRDPDATAKVIHQVISARVIRQVISARVIRQVISAREYRMA
jgi:TNFR/NGFR cysteine-rich region/Tyrosine-protein kinase ephrin type A/B receptor-like